jgi:hypothetical protein
VRGMVLRQSPTSKPTVTAEAIMIVHTKATNAGWCVAIEQWYATHRCLAASGNPLEIHRGGRVCLSIAARTHAARSQTASATERKVRARARVCVCVCACACVCVCVCVARAYACAARLHSREGSPMIAENRDFKGSFGFSEAPRTLLCQDTLSDANAVPRSSSAIASRTSRFFLRSDTHSCASACSAPLCCAARRCVCVCVCVLVRACDSAVCARSRVSACAVPCVCAPSERVRALRGWVGVGGEGAAPRGAPESFGTDCSGLGHRLQPLSFEFKLHGRSRRYQPHPRAVAYAPLVSSAEYPPGGGGCMPRGVSSSCTLVFVCLCVCLCVRVPGACILAVALFMLVVTMPTKSEKSTKADMTMKMMK